MDVTYTPLMPLFIKTDHLRRYRQGWGKDVVIHDKVVDVATTRWDAMSGLKAALADSVDAVVRLNPNLDGQTILMDSSVTWNGNVTLDGTFANVRLAMADGGSRSFTFIWVNGNNAIFGCHLDGRMVPRQAITMDRSENYLVSHCTFENYRDDAIHCGGGSRFPDSGTRISILDVRLRGVIEKGINFDTDGRTGQLSGRNRRFSVGRCHITAGVRARGPQSSGGRQCHWWNNLLDGQADRPWMYCKHGHANLAADGNEGAGALCQANAHLHYGLLQAAEIGSVNTLHPSHGGGEINSYIWYDSAYPSYYDASIDNDGAPNRFDFRAAEPPKAPGAPGKVDVAPVPGYYPTPYPAEDVPRRVRDEAGHLGSTLLRFHN